MTRCPIVYYGLYILSLLKTKSFELETYDLNITDGFRDLDLKLSKVVFLCHSKGPFKIKRDTQGGGGRDSVTKWHKG